MFYWVCAASITFSGSLVYHAVQNVRGTPAESCASSSGLSPARFHAVIGPEDDLQDIFLASMRQRGGAGMNVEEFADILGVAIGRAIDPDDEHLQNIFTAFAEPRRLDGPSLLSKVPLLGNGATTAANDLVMYPRGMMQLLSRHQGYRELHGRNPEE